MLARMQKALKEKDQGFTLIELLVVIVIIGILAAIAIPVYLSQREKGIQAGIKSDIKAVATAQETYYVDKAEYTTDLAALDVNITDGNAVAVTVPPTAAGTFCVAGSNSGTDTNYWYDSVSGKTIDIANELEGACTGVSAPAAPDEDA